MKNKAKTPLQKARQRYEVRNKEYREQATKQFNTRISSETYYEICEFLRKNKKTKVELIIAGYQALQNQYGPKKTE